MIAENKLKNQFQNYFEFQPFMGQAYVYLDVFFFSTERWHQPLSLCKFRWLEDVDKCLCGSTID